MLVTKTGIRRNGHELHNYRNLVWLGRPANIASKLTDLANKSGETLTIVKLNVAYQNPLSTTTGDWIWTEEYPHSFVPQLGTTGFPEYRIKHDNPAYRSHFTVPDFVVMRPTTPPILMTELVWKGYADANPSADRVTKKWFKEYKVDVPGLNSKVIGGDVTYNVFKP